ncbi:hypothetical protein GF325_01975 [Candidatus Bathyarchaeota archaeon]|nr:hypothetical protein [Candidatus Bathyarchaeota archaeon]
MMLQDIVLFGLKYFGLFNLVNYILVGIMLFGLHDQFKNTSMKTDKIIATIALGGCLTAFAHSMRLPTKPSCSPISATNTCRHRPVRNARCYCPRRKR